jgi:cysteine-rich repeat protein
MTVDPGEECDEGPQGGSSCTSLCRNAFCGDGVVTSPEECDDGNAADGDACSSACTTPPEKCGNGQNDPGEDCDDGNRQGGDGCEADCRRPREDDGDAGLDAGPEGEDGGEADAATDDAGDASTQPERDGAVPTSDVAGEIPECAACRDGACTSFFGQINLIDECFNAGGNATDAQLCIDVMNCAYSNDCAYGPDGLNTCFCGTAEIASGACAQPGAANGPCRAEMFAAAKTKDLPTFLSSVQLTELPIGRALYLAQCDRDSCGSECTP